VTAAAGANGLRALLPMSSTAGTLTAVTMGGNPVPWTAQKIKGISYAVFAAGSGTYTATYAP
jgi:hypothetical protein